MENTSRLTVATDRHVYSVKKYGERFELCRQPINAKTGKPWQAFQTVEKFEGHNAELRARWALTKIKGTPSLTEAR